MSLAKKPQLGPGRLLIINNNVFINKSWNRRGSEKDAKLLRKHFGEYQVPSKEILDPTLKEIQREINKMENHDFTENSCFICAILTHGDKNNIIFSSDLKPYSLDEDIIEPIQRNKTLFGKPKIFIVQACKGVTQIDNGIFSTKKTNEMDTHYTNRINFTNCSKSSSQRDPGKCWKFCSTSEGFVSYRNEDTGSLFISSFCRNLKKYGSKRNIEEIFDLASKETQRMSSETGLKQIPSKTIQEQMDYIFGDYCKYPATSNVSRDELVTTDSATIETFGPLNSDFLPTQHIPSTRFPPVEKRVNQESVIEQLKRPLSTSKSEIIDRQLMKMIAKEYHPFSIIQDPEFKKFIQLLNPCYSIPEKKTFSTCILPQVYQEVRDNVRIQIKSAVVVALATDEWTSSSNQSYYSVTAHYINDECELQSFLLDCFECSDQTHIGEMLYTELKRMLAEWNLEHKICAIVTANESNIVPAIRLGDWPHISCFAHKLNVTVQRAILSIDEVRNKIKSIVKYFKRSPQAMNKLQSIQKQVEVVNMKLKQDIPTRWSSTYEMFSKYLLLKDPIASILQQMNANLLIPTVEENDLIQKICDILQVFDEVTNEISSEKNVTLSKIVIFAKSLEKYISNILNQAELQKEFTDMANIIMKELNDGFTFAGMFSSFLYEESALLDPRFKELAFIGNDNIKVIIEAAVQRANKFSSTSNPVECAPIPTKKLSSLVWADFDEIAANALATVNVSPAKSEMEKYLMEPIIDRSEDPLSWWNQKKHIYPHLFQLMKQRLCIPATSVPAKQIFSKTGQAITERRSTLSGGKIHQLLFLNSNY